MLRRIVQVGLFLITAGPLIGASALPADKILPNNHEVKYVILMVPDGMNLSSVTAARIRLNGITGNPLYLETLEHIGYQRTYSEKNTVTDSSAAASTWACGEKFVNNEVCFHIDGRPNNLSLLELAKARGMSAGLVATQTITHATPASFGAHVNAPLGVSPRSCETEIARQYVTESQPDVLLGGGRSKFAPASADACGAIGNFSDLAQSLGYTYVTTATELAGAIESQPTKLLGLFAGGQLTPEYLRTPSTTEPRLPEMTEAALSVLERNQTGFFLMVEGSLIDSGNHSANIDYLVGEMAAFDASVRVVLDWIAAKPDRMEHALLMVLPDHETGALAIHGTEKPGGEPFGYFWPAYTWRVPPEPETHHTGGDVVFWVQGPGSEVLAAPIENAFVYHVIRELLR
ncbi:MAG: Alkaline phosphatase [Acidobacteria bacterium]|nr:Alkaline phosphatase [Acidobacteriota bacterium]